MNLKDFVSRALCDIVDGVKDAQEKTDKGTIVPSVSNSFKSVETGIAHISPVEFEVTVSAGKHSGSEAKLNVVAVFVGGGVKGESGANEGQAAKLKFRVPVKLPVSK